jgi:anti-anti-sigma regulatory factor
LIVSDQETEPLVLPARIRFGEAEQLLADIVAYPDELPLVIDASGVEQMTSAAVIALLSGLSTRREGAQVAIANATSDFVDAFNDLGLFREMMKMEFRT